MSAGNKPTKKGGKKGKAAKAAIVNVIDEGIPAPKPKKRVDKPVQGTIENKPDGGILPAHKTTKATPKPVPAPVN